MDFFPQATRAALYLAAFSVATVGVAACSTDQGTGAGATGSMGTDGTNGSTTGGSGGSTATTTGGPSTGASASSGGGVSGNGSTDGSNGGASVTSTGATNGGSTSSSATGTPGDASNAGTGNSTGNTTSTTSTGTSSTGTIPVDAAARDGEAGGRGADAGNPDASLDGGGRRDGAVADGSATGDAASGPSGTPTVLSDDGGWCWFQTPRALFYGTRLIIGTVSSGTSNAAIRGNVRALVYDFTTAKTSIFELHTQLELDDHDSPAFLVRPDGRLLTLFGKHDSENHFYYRISQAADGLTWGTEQTYVPSASTSLTYSNIFMLPAEANRIYDFYRGLDGSFKPSYAYSDDSGQTWKSGNVVVNVPSTGTLQRPYVRYVSNGNDTIHLIYGEGHPRDFDTSLFHIYYKASSLYKSDGSLIGPLTTGLAMPTQGTRIFAGDSQHVAWASDIVIDPQGHPVVTYSVQMNSAGLPTGQGGDDIRYRYARWDGATWIDNALAYAGSRLYSGEDDYSGLATLDPDNTSVVYISTNADPLTGAPLKSAGDNLRHYEIFRSTTADGGKTWAFTPITHDSTVDNLRPLLPAGGDGHQKALLWLRGQYRAYTDYTQQVVALFWRQ